MEEELQLSVVVSGESDYQSDDAARPKRSTGIANDSRMRDEGTDQDASGEDVGLDEDASGEDEIMPSAPTAAQVGRSEAEDSDEEDDSSAENGAGNESVASAGDWDEAEEEDEDVAPEPVVIKRKRGRPRKRKSSSMEIDDDALAIRKRRRNPMLDFESAADTGDDQQTNDKTSRTMRLKSTRPPPPVSIETKTDDSLVVKIQVRPGNLKEILSRKKRDRRDRDRKRATAGPGRPPKNTTSSTPALDVPFSALPTPFGAVSYSQPFYSFFDKDTDEAKGKPYGGILNEAEADTSKTMPTADDRRKFDNAKQIVIDEWKIRELENEANMEAPVRKSRKTGDDASKIRCIEFGGWEIDTWYAAPYPAEYSINRVLYICEFCLKYMNSDYVAWRHKLKCGTKHPPGDEIYRNGSISVFEVDGRKNPVYCQNLCLLAKLFLGSKTLYYDVEPFLFYVLCEFDDYGYHFVGYFSKEKRASSQNNVSCILTLPIHQRKGYGNLLIDFSYLLTRVEEKTGSPEKPLSDMGLVSYRNYWRLRMCRYFLDTLESGAHRENGLSIKNISDDTGMTADDVVAALEGLRALVRDPETKLYAFRIDLEYCRQYWDKWESKGYVQLDPAALVWTPYVMGKSNAVNFELGPINAIASREDDEAKVDEGPNGISTVDDAGTVLPDSLVNGDLPEVIVGHALPNQNHEGDEKENDPPKDDTMVDADEDNWDAPYKDIPPSRFEVFPAVSGSRRDRGRPVGRPPGSRSGNTPKRRRSGPGRPRSSTSRRRSGGTGRGPGRWPKGTKKADYGNADSGPGMPPTWQPGDPMEGVYDASQTPGYSTDATAQVAIPPELNGLPRMTGVPIPVPPGAIDDESEEEEEEEEEDDEEEDEEDEEDDDEEEEEDDDRESGSGEEDEDEDEEGDEDEDGEEEDDEEEEEEEDEDVDASGEEE